MAIYTRPNTGWAGFGDVLNALSQSYLQEKRRKQQDQLEELQHQQLLDQIKRQQEQDRRQAEVQAAIEKANKPVTEFKRPEQPRPEGPMRDNRPSFLDDMLKGQQQYQGPVPPPQGWQSPPPPIWAGQTTERPLSMQEKEGIVRPPLAAMLANQPQFAHSFDTLLAGATGAPTPEATGVQVAKINAGSRETVAEGKNTAAAERQKKNLDFKGKVEKIRGDLAQHMINLRKRKLTNDEHALIFNAAVKAAQGDSTELVRLQGSLSNAQKTAMPANVIQGFAPPNLQGKDYIGPDGKKVKVFPGDPRYMDAYFQEMKALAASAGIGDEG